ncbi:MAG: glycosyltransferase family 2 protein [Phycisphaerae bacterium]|nr:glycosyltransferase family 2 protein [Phycisphaerae bacterium]
MPEPKVSVCLPCYNRQDYVGESIESVLNQTFSDFELIITDNCSTDGTVEIIKKYASKDSRIRFYINDSNLGVIGNLNRGILLGRGEYIKPIFSDDLLDTRCLEGFVNVLDKNPSVSLATSFNKAFGKSDLVRDEKFFPNTGLLNGKKGQKSLFFDGNWVGSPSSVIFRRKDLHIGLFNLMWKYWLGDLDMWMRLLGVGDAYIVPEILSFLRIHDKSESAIHGVDFRLIKERLLLANIAFEFPHMYGQFTAKEQKEIHYHLLKRLVREGLGKRGLNAKISMFKLGLSRLAYSRIVFFILLMANLPRLFKKSRFSETDGD